MAYAPGSFTKNFAWHGKGFSKLHEAIRAGFRGKLAPVTRKNWRSQSHLSDADFYIAANFFLFNVIQIRHERDPGGRARYPGTHFTSLGGF